MKELRFFIVVLLVLSGCDASQEDIAVSPANHDSASESIVYNLDPSDYAVPADAFQQFDIDQFAGAISFKSDTFSKWLDKTGHFGEFVALSDTRIFELAVEATIQRSNVEGATDNQQLGDPDDIHTIPENRVCDMAYQLIAEKYDGDNLGYRVSYEQRDKLIEAVRAKIKKSMVQTKPKR